MQRAGILILFLFGLPGMVDDYHAWTKVLGFDLPLGVGTALVGTAIGWAVLFACYRVGKGWATNLPLVGSWWALRRFKQLENTLEDFSSGGGIEYVRINELALRLKKIGIEYPKAGIAPNLRKMVTADLLAACRAGDLEAARSAWRNTQKNWTER